jgi:hypothetical protein
MTHDLVCAGQISLTSAQHEIAANWQALYKKEFGSARAGRAIRVMVSYEAT